MRPEHATPRIEPPQQRPPAAAGAPLQAQWRPSTAAPVNPRSHARRNRWLIVAGALGVLGVLFVFLALPRWFDTPQPPRVTTSSPRPVEQAPATKAEIDFAALARAKQQADELRAPLSARLDKLTARGAEQWGAADFGAARAALSAADAAYQQREYVTAVGHLQRIEPLAQALEQRAEVVLKEQVQAGEQALETGRSADAHNAFQLATKLAADHGQAAAGLKRAKVLDEVLRLSADAERSEAGGDLQAALATFRRALALDPLTRRATDGVTRIENRIASDAFASAMARGYEALAARRYPESRAAFEAARKLRPDAAEITTALQQIEQEQRTGTIETRLAAAARAEREERWASALQDYRAILELDPTIAAANDGVARTQPRAALHEQFELYRTQPERLFSQPVRTAANEALAQARAIANPGPVLQQQISTITQWLARASAPVQIALQSDNLTDVTIYRVTRLGAFAQRSLELTPGAYTIVGTRPGYRDVRRQVQITPDFAESIVIRCEDPI